MTHYLRFDSESTFRSAAFIAGLCDEEGTYTQYTHDHAMDIVGVLMNDDAVVGPDGTVVTPATPMAGWHVNYVGKLPTGWDGFLASPVAPRRVFAGVG